jgi:LysM repeat protein
MTTRHSSSSIVCALAFALVVAPTFRARAQTAAPADASSSNAAPAVPAATPAPAAPSEATTAPASTEHPSTYTIAQGDSLWTIAHKYGTTVVKLRKLNNLKKGALLHPGQVLQLPPATSDTSTK